MPKNYEWVEGWSNVEDTCWDNVDSLWLTTSYHIVDWLNMGRILSGYDIERMLIWSKFRYVSGHGTTILTQHPKLMFKRLPQTPTNTTDTTDTKYRAEKISLYVVWWSLFLLLLITSVPSCPCIILATMYKENFSALYWHKHDCECHNQTTEFC